MKRIKPDDVLLWMGFISINVAIRRDEFFGFSYITTFIISGMIGYLMLANLVRIGQLSYVYDGWQRALPLLFFAIVVIWIGVNYNQIVQRFDYDYVNLRLAAFSILPYCLYAFLRLPVFLGTKPAVEYRSKSNRNGSGLSA